jgi:polysaccharide biosynthesis/export protein
MRVVRFLILAVGMATAVAGCAQQPVAYMTYPPAGAYPTAGPAYGAGIDHVVYGTGGAYVPPRPAVAYAPPPAPAAVAAPAPIALPTPAVAGVPTPAAAAPVRYASAVPVQMPPAPEVAPPARYVSAPPAAAPAAVAAPAPAAAARPVRVASAIPVAVPAGPVAVAAPMAYAPVVAPPDYTLDSGDRLRVVVFGQEGLTNAYLVDAAGCIDVPLIGQVPARGATTEELAGRIAAKLRNGFIREPHVAVEVEAYRPFFILGEVTAPGQYPYVPRMTAETAVAIAGGFTPRAFRRNLIVDRPIAGRIVRMSVPPSFPIHPGDTVNVQERWF